MEFFPFVWDIEIFQDLQTVFLKKNNKKTLCPTWLFTCPKTNGKFLFLSPAFTLCLYAI